MSKSWADMIELLSLPVATCYGQVLYHVLLQSTSKSSEPLSHTDQLKRTGGTAFEVQRLWIAAFFDKCATQLQPPCELC